MLILDPFGNLFDPLPTEPKTPTFVDENKCWNCSRELCADLDSYYGKDDLLKKLCVKCRTKVLKDEAELTGGRK